MNKRKLLLWILQIIPAIILLQAFFFKFTGAEGPISVFDALGIGRGGMMLIAFLELAAAIGLLIPRFTASGALLGFAVMIGAVLAHFSLGISVHNDGGMLFMMALVVLITTGTVAYLRKNEIPIIGKTCDQ